MAPPFIFHQYLVGNDLSNITTFISVGVEIIEFQSQKYTGYDVSTINTFIGAEIKEFQYIYIYKSKKIKTVNRINQIVMHYYLLVQITYGSANMIKKFKSKLLSNKLLMLYISKITYANFQCGMECYKLSGVLYE